jgi:ribosomal protein S1
MSIATRFVAGLVVLSFVWVGPALAADKNAPRAGCNQPGASAGTTSATKPPEKIEGQVVAVDPARSIVTVKDTSGTTHEFQANKDEIPSYKVGDKIEAKLRSAPNC